MHVIEKLSLLTVVCVFGGVTGFDEMGQQALRQVLPSRRLLPVHFYILRLERYVFISEIILSFKNNAFLKKT